MPAKRRSHGSLRNTGSPFLRRVESLPQEVDPTSYPFNVRALSRGIDLTFRSKVTFFVGENGSGKSTLLEAIAECCGFNPQGGNRDHHRATFAERSPLAKAIRLSWLPKVTQRFFMRAQFLIATHSPILLSYPGAVLYDLDGDTIRETTYRDTKHFLLTRDFLNAPEQFFKHLFATPEAGDSDTEH